MIRMTTARGFIVALGAIFLVCCAANQAAAGYIDHFSDPTDIGPNKIPHSGAIPVLIIRLEIGWPDWSSTVSFMSTTPADGNFTDYWSRSSLSTYLPQPVLPPPVHYDTCPLAPPYDDCVIDRGDVLALVPALNLLREALSRADLELGVDFSQFDSNGDGWVDGVLLLTNASIGGIALPISELATLPGFSMDDFTFDGVKVNAVAVAELGDWRNNLHEFGHLLGFDDMYNEDMLDVTNPQAGLEQNPGSAHSLMGDGYGRYTMLNAVDRARIGWATSVIPVTSTLTAVRIPPVAESGVVYQIGSGNEHFLIENRRPSRPGDSWYPLDSNIPGNGGLAIYRVLEGRQPNPDFKIIQRMLECPNCNEFRPFIFFEQADGLFEYQSTAGFSHLHDAGDFFGTGDALLPSANIDPISRSNLVLRSNFLSGAQNGAEVKDIDSESAYPDVIATLVPMSGGSCGSIAPAGSNGAMSGSSSSAQAFLVALLPALAMRLKGAAHRNRRRG